MFITKFWQELGVSEGTIMIVSITILIIFGVLNVSALISLACLHGDLKRIANEIKFLNRRSDILDVNDTLRHVPRNVTSDYFNRGDISNEE